MTRPTRPAAPRTGRAPVAGPARATGGARPSGSSARPVATGRPASPVTRPAAPSVSRPPAAAPAATRPGASTRPPASPEPDLGSLSAAMAGAPRWVSGLLAGVQAALLSLLVVVTPALAAYVATSADPSNAEVGWPRSVAVGAALWLMGHGAPVLVDGVLVTLVPLGITGLALFSAYASARRSAHAAWSAWAAGLGGYVGVVGVVALTTGSAGPLGAGGPALLRTFVGATAVGAAGLALGMVRRSGWRELTRPVWSRVPPLLRVGIRAGALVTALTATVAALLVTTWTISGRAAAGDVVAGLGLDGFSGVLLAVAQLAVLPNLVLWGVAWVAGPGFAVGAGTLFAPAEVTSGPLPALPLLGALPTHAGGPLRWAPLVVVATGCVAGWWLHRRLAAGSWRRPFAASGCAALVAGLTTAALVAVSGGAVGPGRLETVGAEPLVVGGWVALLALAGSLLVSVPADKAVRAGVRAGLGAAARSVRGGRRAADAPDDDAAAVARSTGSRRPPSDDGRAVSRGP